VSGIHKGTRVHEWHAEGDAKRCWRCGMLSTWAGAREACTGMAEFRAGRGQPIGGGGSTPSPLRAAVVAAGVSWSAYETRRRRGQSHEQAMAALRDGHTSMPEHDSEQRKGSAENRNPRGVGAPGGLTGTEESSR
jgi:hypothetical protein